jgi:hypothetical protein
VSDILKDFVEVKLHNDEDFLKICETLTRMGVTNKEQTKLFQSCHLFHKRGNYFLVHYKELLKLDGYIVDITEEDYQRRNKIVALLEQWNLLSCVDQFKIENQLEIAKLKVVSFIDKSKFQLVPKYRIGRKN